MVDLVVCKNVVFLRKCQKSYQDFVSSFLVKYESVKKIDFYNSTKTRKVFKTVKERRDLYSETSEYIVFSRGMLEMIPREYYNPKYVGSDTVITPELSDEEIRKSLSTFDLRDDQVVAVRKCLLAKRGVIQLPTATGKSAIITSTIKQLLKVNPEMKFLVLSPSLSTVNSINDTFKINGLDSRIFGHPDKSIDSPVTVSLVQSLVNYDQSKDLLRNVSAAFYDECLPGNSSILLPDGSHATMIKVFEDETINEVLSYNIETRHYEVKRILRKFKTPFNNRFCKVYYFDENDNKLKGVTCTLNHRIYVKGKGYVQAQDLVEGDLVKIDYPFTRNWTTLDDFTYMKVRRVSPNIGRISEYKYNIEVEDNHNYFANDVLVSNCHHLKCETWNKLNALLPNLEYSLGFSALSIDRSEIYERDIRNICYESSLIVGSSGPVLMHMDPSYYIERGIIALPVIFRVKNDEQLPSNIDQSNWSQVVKFGLMSTSRTVKISSIAKMFSDNNRKVLILVSEKDYAFVICDFLCKLGCYNFGVSFGSGEGYSFSSYDYDDLSESYKVFYNKEDSLNILSKLSSGDINILIATSHLDEGVDVKGLDACILSSGGKKDRRIIQRVGRVLRKSKNGKYAYIVDFTDSGSYVLSRHSKARLKMYIDDIGVPSNNIYDGIDVNELNLKFMELEGLI